MYYLEQEMRKSRIFHQQILADEQLKPKECVGGLDEAAAVRLVIGAIFMLLLFKHTSHFSVIF